MSSTTLAESGLSGSRKRIKRLNLLLFGPYGSAKTVLAHGLPRTRTLDFDDGMQSVEWAILEGVLDRSLDEVVYRTILPPEAEWSDKKNKVYDEATLQVDEWLAEEDIPPEEWDRPYPQFWDTLIIDSGTALTDASKIKGLQENARLDLSKSWKKVKSRGAHITPMMMQDWGAASFMFQKFINYCRTLGKNLVLICHEREDTDSAGSPRAIKPALIGQLRDSVPKDFDEVWYAYVKGSRINPKFVFQTLPDPLRKCRTRLGCLDAEEDSDFSAIRAKVAKFYNIPEDRLWAAAHGSEERKSARKDEAEEAAMV